MNHPPIKERPIDGVAWTLAMRYARARLPDARNALRARIVQIGANPSKIPSSKAVK